MKGLRTGVMMAALLAGAGGAIAVTQTSVQDSAPQDAVQPSATQNKSSAQHPAEKYDTKLPVEISSDNLEVLQHENKAIFRGNVIAVQGKIRLNSDVMVVHYRQGNSPAGTPGSAPAPAPKPVPIPTPTPTPSSSPSPAPAAGMMGAITLIEVEGNVFMATPEESAKGDRGDYKVDEKLLHLYGDNVILTRDKNILRGTELVYNLETGRSVLTNKGAAVNGPNGGRVRGIFVPTQDDNGKGAAKNKVKPGVTPSPTPTPAPAPAPATSSE